MSIRDQVRALLRGAREAAVLLWRGRSLIEAPAGNELGRRGESEAARRMRAAGYRVLARNVRTRDGEADLVCRAPDARTIVIVEVKTRRLVDSRTEDGLHITPERSITVEKRRKLASVRRSLIAANGWRDRVVRVDVIALELDDRETDASGRPVERWTIRHHLDILAN